MRVALALFIFVAACVDQGNGSSGRGGGSDDDMSCCDLYPDVDAVNACVALPANTCGTLLCQTDDGPKRVPVCGPHE